MDESIYSLKKIVILKNGMCLRNPLQIITTTAEILDLEFVSIVQLDLR